MMREILFRGRRKGCGEWCYGFFTLREFKAPAIFVPSKEPLEYAKYFGIRYCVEPETIGQFVGINDKNGKKVFEGDIIKFHKYRYEPDWYGAVSYDRCCYVVKGIMPLSYEKRKDKKAEKCPFEIQLSGIDKTTIEVIGNIHDNSELTERWSE